MTKKSKKLGAERRQILNLNRAINKIDAKTASSWKVAEHAIEGIKANPTTLEYKIDGRVKKISYHDINKLSESEQASLWGAAAERRTKIREKLAIEQLKEKGEISWQFKREAGKTDIKLRENIMEFESITKGNTKEMLKEEFSKYETIEDIEEHLDTFFQTDDGNGLTGSDKMFDFYRPGEAGGFSELNTFTMNTYRMMNG